MKTITIGILAFSLVLLGQQRSIAELNFDFAQGSNPDEVVMRGSGSITGTVATLKSDGRFHVPGLVVANPSDTRWVSVGAVGSPGTMFPGTWSGDVFTAGGNLTTVGPGSNLGFTISGGGTGSHTFTGLRFVGDSSGNQFLQLLNLEGGSGVNYPAHVDDPITVTVSGVSTFDLSALGEFSDLVQGSHTHSGNHADTERFANSGQVTYNVVPEPSCFLFMCTLLGLRLGKRPSSVCRKNASSGK